MADCIEYIGCSTDQGYGRKWHDGKMRKAHRVAYVLVHGLSHEDIEGLVVRHSCDNPPCINPQHLVLGTQDQNMRDMVEQGRSCSGDRHRAVRPNMPKDSSHANSTLSEILVSEIQNLLAQGLSQRAIARQFGASQPLISRINTNKAWRHCNG